MEKEDTLVLETTQTPLLGFDDARSSNNNGGCNLPLFNLPEFLRLAHTVIDEGDEQAKASLTELKTKWENRFGKEATKHIFPATMATGGGFELARGLRKAWRTLIPLDRRLEKVAPTRLKVVSGSVIGLPEFGQFPTTTRLPTGLPETDWPAMTGQNGKRTADLENWRSDVARDMALTGLGDISIDVVADVTVVGADLTGTVAEGFVAIPKAVDSPPKVGTGHGYEEVEAYTSACLIKLRHLPMEFRTTEGLSTVASGVGKTLYQDAIMRACTRLDFARLCVMLDVTQKLTRHVIIMTPDEDGGETPCKVDVEYEWLPPKCTTCMTLGHMAKDCAMNRPQEPTKPPVAVYVPKVNVSPPPPPKKERKTPNQHYEVVDVPKPNEGDVHVERNASKHDDRGKAVVIYNAFDALHLINDADESPGGPNTCNPVSDDPC
ncbi:UNVERIFIED_CONTAM: hypothetical protein Sindi_1970100 [Sesamum indicum]